MQKNNSLGDKFAGFSSKPDPSVWENIERSLDEKPRRKAFIWWWTAFAASIVVGIVAWNFQESVSPQKPKYTSGKNVLSEEKNQADLKVDTNLRVGQNQSSYATIQQKQSHVEQAHNPSLEKKYTFRENDILPNNLSDKTTSNNQYLDESSHPENLNNQTSSHTKTDTTNDLTNHPNVEPQDSLLAKDETENPEKIVDTTIVAKEVELNIKPLETKRSNWQLQVQLGAFASQRYKMVAIPVSQYSAANEGLTSGISNGYYSIVPGNPNVTKIYRNVQMNYGILASYNTAKRWRFTSGISYLRYYTYIIDDRQLMSGAHFMQIPLIADFKLIDKSKWEWSLGTGTGLGCVFEKQSNANVSSWRSDFIAQTSLRYAISQKWMLQLQPQARFIFWDSQIGEVDKLSPWNWGGNIGAIWNF